jgi:hypothetical protein
MMAFSSSRRNCKNHDEGQNARQDWDDHQKSAAENRGQRRRCCVDEFFMIWTLSDDIDLPQNTSRLPSLFTLWRLGHFLDQLCIQNYFDHYRPVMGDGLGYHLIQLFRYRYLDAETATATRKGRKTQIMKHLIYGLPFSCQLLCLCYLSRYHFSGNHRHSFLGSYVSLSRGKVQPLVCRHVILWCALAHKISQPEETLSV